jgi:two-component system cell cycle response regulator DivK
MTVLKILYIEDNTENRLLIRRVLMAENHLVFEADSAIKALEWLSSNHPDMILVDINMPEIDGYTLTSRIRSIAGFEFIPIVAITANVLHGDREKSLLAGCTGYLQKPLDIDLLPAQIMNFWRSNVSI